MLPPEQKAKERSGDRYPPVGRVLCLNGSGSGPQVPDEGGGINGIPKNYCARPQVIRR